ncbi:hypothetical protein [Acidiphilium sp.]|uniref:hypothetical protein n=1 Tax=Acidiphilium sp. TaxID=527 RepID=UPI0025903CC5|nr:hypothetical protein [Acidiphilium sp.]
MDDMGAEPGCGDGDDYEDLAGIFWSAEVDQVIRRRSSGQAQGSARSLSQTDQAVSEILHLGGS